uniref:Putative flotillin n=1 Tax=Aedes albopictus TaxID=7160 RepID=A0A023ER67_AEDAL
MVWGFVTCGPNEALVVSGCCHMKPLLVPGGRAFVWPSVQRVQRISLNTMTLQVESPTVYTSQGVPISVTGIAQVKIQGQNEDMLLTACEQFLGKSEAEIQHIALVTLEGHQRAIMGSMTVEEIYKDRKKFSKQVFEVASSDLVNMGITVVSYTLKDIRDEEGYLKSLGMARTAEVKRDARIGEAEARCDATIKEAIAEEQRMASRFLNDTEIAKAQRDFELKKAVYDVEVQTKKAEAFAIAAKSKAEAEQLAKKAEAWREYREAAMVDMLLDTLPKVAAEVAAPLSQAKKITMVSSGTGEVGAAKLTGEVLQIVNKIPDLVKSITGVDISRSVHAG